MALVSSKVVSAVLALLLLPAVPIRAVRDEKCFDEEQEGLATASGFSKLKVVSAPLSTRCPTWFDDLNKTFADLEKRLGNDIDEYVRQAVAGACGIVGEDESGLQAHMERIWKLLKSAQEAGQEQGGGVLHMFVAPEWALARRYQTSANAYSPPLGASDLVWAIDFLGRKMEASGKFQDWVVAPGSFFWGEKTTQGDRKYAVFNSLPIFFRGRLLWVHNKRSEADHLHKDHEVWGYDVGRSDFEGSAALDLVLKYGFRKTADFVVIDGWTLGVDICMDSTVSGHRAFNRTHHLPVSKHSRARFDLQLLVSSGLPKLFDEHLSLRKRGVAVWVDGSVPQKFPLYLRKTGTTGGAHQVEKKFPSDMRNSWKTKWDSGWGFLQLRPLALNCSVAEQNPDGGFDVCSKCQRWANTSVMSAKVFCATQPSNYALFFLYPAVDLKEQKQRYKGQSTAIVNGSRTGPLDEAAFEAA